MLVAEHRRRCVMRRQVLAELGVVTESSSSRVASATDFIGSRRPVGVPPPAHRLTPLRRNAAPENSAIYVSSVDKQEPKRLLQVHSSVAYAAPGYLLYVRETTLMAQPFDAEKGELTGEALPMAEDAARNPLNGRAFVSVSDNGVLALRQGAVVRNQLIWFDRTGKQLGVLTPPGNYSAPALSPDQKTVAVSLLDFQTT